MKKICLIYCHPNPSSLNAAIADAYERGASAGGHSVRRLNLYEMKYDPSVVFTGIGKQQELEPDLVAAQEAIQWAEHVVFVFPTWWGSTPARLKGFFDRTFLEGWAYRYDDLKSLLPRKLLAGRTAHLLYTMNTPPLLFQLIIGDPVWRSLKLGTLGFVGLTPVRRTVFGPVKKSSETQRKRWLAAVEADGKRGK